MRPLEIVQSWADKALPCPPVAWIDRVSSVSASKGSSRGICYIHISSQQTVPWKPEDIQAAILDSSINLVTCSDNAVTFSIYMSDLYKKFI